MSTKQSALKVGKYLLIGYMAVTAIYFAYLQFIREDEDTAVVQGSQSFNVKRNLSAAGTTFVNMGKSIAWPYFLLSSETSAARTPSNVASDFYAYLKTKDESLKESIIDYYEDGDKNFQDAVWSKCRQIAICEQDLASSLIDAAEGQPCELSSYANTNTENLKTFYHENVIVADMLERF